MGLVELLLLSGVILLAIYLVAGTFFPGYDSRPIISGSPAPWYNELSDVTPEDREWCERHTELCKW